jgi:bacterioferritin-associated ferredoxin
VGEVYTCLGCSPNCGRCARTILAIMREAGADQGCTSCPLGHCSHAEHETLIAAE